MKSVDRHLPRTKEGPSQKWLALLLFFVFHDTRRFWIRKMTEIEGSILAGRQTALPVQRKITDINPNMLKNNKNKFRALTRRKSYGIVNRKSRIELTS